MSGSFWRGCGAIVFLSICGFITLTSGSYKGGVTAPAVERGPALVATVVLAVVSVGALWLWERRGSGSQRR